MSPKISELKMQGCKTKFTLHETDDAGLQIRSRTARMKDAGLQYRSRTAGIKFVALKL